MQVNSGRNTSVTYGLHSLGSGEGTKPSYALETFPNPEMQDPYLIRIETAEFTAVCPVTGQPDFAKIRLEYVPAERCVELKAFKLYLWSYRDKGIFHEAVTNQIATDLQKILEPRWIRVTGIFNVRGGVYTSVVAERGVWPETLANYPDLAPPQVL